MILLLLNLLAIVANALVVNGECQCGILLLDESGTSVSGEVYLSRTHPQACDRLELDQLCRDFCYQTFVNLTAGGNLESTSPVFNMSSGEMFCENLQQDVDRREVGGYYRWCQASWNYVGIKSSHPLCCTNSSYIRCEVEVGQLLTSTEPMPQLIPTDPSPSETNQTVEAPANPSDVSDDSQNETSALRKKRNLVEVIQVPRKVSEKSISSGPKTPSKQTSPRSKRSMPETAQEPILATLYANAVEEDGTNATEEATGKSAARAESKNWSPNVNSSDWIPITYLPNAVVEEKNESRTSTSSALHLTTDFLIATNDSSEKTTKYVMEEVAMDDGTSKLKSEDSKNDKEIRLKWVVTVKIDHEEETTTTLPVDNATELQFGYHHPNHSTSDMDDWTIQTNETATQVEELVTNSNRDKTQPGLEE